MAGDAGKRAGNGEDEGGNWKEEDSIAA